MVLVMSKSTYMRRLRHKYAISARELAEIAGVSQQFVSDLELGKYAERYDCTQRGEPLMQKAFECAAANRAEQARQLAGDISMYRHCLLELSEDNDEL